MSTKTRRSHHRKRSFIGQLIHDIRKATGNRKSHSSDSSRHGHSRSAHGQELSEPPEIQRETVPVSSHSRRSRSGHKRKRHHKKNIISETISNLQKKWRRRKRNRKKEKFKRRVKRKYIKKERKQRWADFYKNFMPDFSGKSREEPQSESATAVKHPNIHYLYYAVNSVALYMVAYLIVYMIYQFTVLVTASFWGLDSVLFYYDLAFNDFSPLWYRLNIIIITLSGPLISVLIGILVYNYLVKRVKSRVWLKLFYLWIAFHGFNFFLGAFASGVSFDEGFGYVASWLYLNIFWKIFISLVFLFILGIIGYYATPRFLETSNSAYRIRKENRARFLLSQAVIPVFAGGLIIFLIRIPNNMPYDTGNLVTMLFAITPVLFNKNAKPQLKLEKEKRRQTTIHWGYVAMFILLFTAYRVGLNTGLHFMLRFSFSLDITPI